VSEWNDEDGEQGERQNDAERRRKVENDAKVFVSKVDDHDVDEKSNERH